MAERTERVWVEDRRQTVDPAIMAGRFCRVKGCRDERGQRRPAVAAFRRERRVPGGLVDDWWPYCEAHTVGDYEVYRIANGRVEISVPADSLAAKQGYVD